MKHVKLISISLPHQLQRFLCLSRLFIVDLAHGKADVDQDPIARRDALWTHKRDTYVAFHARDIYFGNGICIVHDVYDLTRNTETHMILLCRGCGGRDESRPYEPVPINWPPIRARIRALTFFAAVQKLLLAGQDLCRRHWG